MRPFPQKKAMNEKGRDENKRKVHTLGENLTKSCTSHVFLHEVEDHKVIKREAVF